MKQTVIIIQNTLYHFETGISLYQMFVNLGYNVVWYKTQSVNQRPFKQGLFLQKYGIRSIDINDIPANFIGFVITAYPHPNSSSIPDKKDPIFSFDQENFYFVSHRFAQNNKNKFIQPMTHIDNTICLSPLAKSYGCKYIVFTDYIVPPEYQTLNDTINITIQGHFELQNRDIPLIKYIKLTHEEKQRIHFNIIGTNCGAAYDMIKIAGFNASKHSRLSEIDFYDLLNKSHFIFPMINAYTKGGTYAKQRYSSNFNHALCLNKPLICNDFCQNTYRIPGIYYNRNNFAQQFRLLAQIDNKQYKDMVYRFAESKKYWQSYNTKIIEDMISKQ